MRFAPPALLPLLSGLLFCLPAHAQAGTSPACSAEALPQAARTVASLRHALHAVAVAELDPVVPPAVSVQIARLKAALGTAAEAAMACASPTATPEDLQNTLAAALHANLTGDSETVLITSAHKDLGAYGSDLDVQVLPLATSPRYLEINFRFGIECGDDNLLLVFKQRNSMWQELLRYAAPPYTDVSGALGDFVLLTPITGLAPNINWRVVVAHGQPGCSANNPRSRFDLDLLQPTADPAHPLVAWHLERPYRRGDTPRLATTEETLTFEWIPPAPGHRSATGKPGTGAPSTGPAAPVQIYRFHISSDNQVNAMETAPDTAAGATP